MVLSLLEQHLSPGAQPGGHLPSPKISKHSTAILTFAETFKE